MNDQPKAAMRVRPMTHTDLESVLAWRNDPVVRHHMYTQHEITLAEHQQWFYQASQDRRKHLLVFEIEGQAVGYVNFNETVPGRIATWGFYTAPNAAKGTGRLLGRTALEHAFRDIGLHKVCGEVLERNAPSLKMHEALGFKREGLLRSQHFDGEHCHDIISFGLLAHEWLSQN